MDRGEDIVLHKALGEQDRVLVVVSLPAHEADQRVLAEADLSVVRGRTVRDHLSRLDVISRVDDRLLVVRVRLVASLELRQVVIIDLPVVIAADRDFIARAHHDGSRVARDLADAGVDSRLPLNAGADHRGVRDHQRDRLTLHVGAHQRAVRVIVLQERNHARRDGEDHLRGDIHEVDPLFLERGGLLPVSSGDVRVDEVPLLVERLICLRDREVVLLVRGEIHHGIRDARVLRIALVDHAVRRLDESVLVHARVAREGVDQSDVRALRRLDRAHSAVVRVVDIADLESGAVSREAAGAEGGKPSLVRELGKRVVLVHELGQLGGAEELLHRRRDRLDVDERLRRDLAHVLRAHALPDHALHAGEADAVLVLQELSHGAEAAVSEVVDVIVEADALLQVQIVVNGCKDILAGDVLRNQGVHILPDGVLQGFLISVRRLDEIHQGRVEDALRDAVLRRILDIDKAADVHHHIGKNLHLALGALNPDIRRAGILDLRRGLPREGSAGLGDDLARPGIHCVLRERVSHNPVREVQLLVELVPSDLREVVSSRVKEHGAEKSLRAVHGERLARADLPVELQQAVRVVVGRVLCEARLELRLIAEHLDDLAVRAEAERAQENRDRHLSGAVHADVEHIVRVRLILEPCAAVRNDLAEIALLAELVVLQGKIDARGADELADNDALRAVDHEGPGVSHERKVAHEDLVLLELILILIVKSDFDLDRCGIGRISLLALLDGVLHFIAAELEVHEIQAEVSGEVLDRENILEDLGQSLVQEPVVGILLDFDEVRHLQDFLLSLEAHPDAFAGLDRTHNAFFHVRYHPCMKYTTVALRNSGQKGRTFP